MGAEIIIDTLGDMCDLMCDNVIPSHIHEDTERDYTLNEIISVMDEAEEIIEEAGCEGKRINAKLSAYEQILELINEYRGFDNE